MLIRRRDRPSTYPSTIPTLLNIYSQWDSYHFATHVSSSPIDKIGAIGRNRLGTSLGVDSNSNPVSNTLSPWGFISPFHNQHSSKFFLKGILSQDLTALNNAILSLEYVFKFIDYQANNPLNVSPVYNDGRLPVIATAVSTTSLLEVIGAMSFFLGDIGESLILTSQSSWFQTSTATATYRQRLQALIPLIKVAAYWLASPTLESSNPRPRWKVLSDNDRLNPNRKLVQGRTHYQMGVYFGDERLKALGRSLIQDGLRYQINSYNDAIKVGSSFFSATDIATGNFPYLCYARNLSYLASAPLGYGYFSESGGSDSSYNGVNLMQLCKLFPTISDTEAYFKKQAWEAIVKGISWQVSRIDSTGNISTLDNTRVADSGELYYGKSKSVNYLETLIPLDFYAIISGDLSVMTSTADKMLRLYTLKVIVPNSFQFYAKGLQKIQSGEINLATDTLRIALVQISSTGRYLVDLTNDEYYNQIPGTAQPDIPELLQNQSFNGTTLTANNTYFETVPPLVSNANYQVGALVLYKSTLDAATSPLIAYYSSGIGLPVTTKNNDILIDWSSLGYVLTV